MDKKERAKNAESLPLTSGFKQIDPKQNNANNIPNKSGICLICLRKQAQLPDIGKEVKMKKYDELRVIYIGISERLQERYEEHFTSNDLEISTLRKSLMAMFLNDEKIDEVTLSEWMKDNLLFFYKLREKPKEDKKELIKCYNPPLNLKGNDNPCNKDFRKEVSRRRRIINKLGNR